MIKWIKRNIVKIVRWANEYDQEQVAWESHETHGLSNRTKENGLGFTLYQASGGYIVEHTTYDRKTDRHNTSLHIIHSDKDLGEGLAHVITVEMLRK
jgi:hypothetical protein